MHQVLQEDLLCHCYEYYFALNNVFKKEILNLHKLSNSTYSEFCVTPTHAISSLQIWNHSSNIKPYPVLSLINKIRQTLLRPNTYNQSNAFVAIN